MSTDAMQFVRAERPDAWAWARAWSADAERPRRRAQPMPGGTALVSRARALLVLRAIRAR